MLSKQPIKVYQNSTITVELTSSVLTFDVSYLLDYAENNKPSEQIINDNAKTDFVLPAVEEDVLDNVKRAQTEPTDFNVNNYYKEMNRNTDFIYKEGEYTNNSNIRKMTLLSKYHLLNLITVDKNVNQTSAEIKITFKKGNENINRSFNLTFVEPEKPKEGEKIEPKKEKNNIYLLKDPYSDSLKVYLMILLIFYFNLFFICY